VGLILSQFTQQLGYLHPEAEGLPQHGASLSMSAMLRRCVRDPDLEGLELFLPPALMARPAALAEAARLLLPPERAGRGFLRFHPAHAAPEVWADGKPRILLCIDIEDLPAVRYLRDRFAVGPMPICCDTHAGESQHFIAQLTRVAEAPPAAGDAIICLSDRHREFMARMLADVAPAGSSALALEQIPRAVDTERFRPVDAAGRRQARVQLGLPAEGRIALFFGRVTAYTKADLLPLVEAFIAAAPADAHLLVVGREYPAGYAALLREAGAELGHRLIIRGEASSALRPLHYAASDLFVLPGDNIPEAFGNTVLEAMACGLPVIASDWVGYSDLVRHGVTGELIPTWWMPGLDRVSALSPLAQRNADHLYTGQSLWVDAAALTASLGRLLRAPSAELAAMGAAGRLRAETFAFDLVHGRWRELWQRQLALAGAETQTATALRRAGADRLGQPSRYLQWFGHYASGVVGPGHRFRLNERGRQVAVRARPLRFYDDLLPLVHREILDALFAVLMEQAGWATCAAVVAWAVGRCGRASDDVRFHLGLLLKRGLLDAEPPSSSAA
jgi:glycosyltransferase involved in cell wall biosynthesis